MDCFWVAFVDVADSGIVLSLSFSINVGGLVSGKRFEGCLERLEMFGLSDSVGELSVGKTSG